MSVQAVEQFRERVNQDPDLQYAVSKAWASGPEALVALGKQQGFQFTKEEVLEGVAHARGGPLTEVEAQIASGELSDFDLEMIAGGGDPGVQNGDITCTRSTKTNI